VPEHSTISVLFIDDDPALARLIQRTLEPKGYVLEHAPNGSMGLERLRQGGIDVVALDHTMPGQSGLEVLAEIRALPDPPPVIYVTGLEDSHIAVAALKSGAVDYVWKDVHGNFRELLAEAIATALDQERLRRAKEQAEGEVRAARDRAEMMLLEMNHRVANSLALVSAMASMQAKAVSDAAARQAVEEMQARINAIAGVHRRLYTSHDVQSVDIDAYLAGLIQELETTMLASSHGHIIRLDAASLKMPTDKAVSLGVAVTELLTNSLKYAYPAGTGGEIRVKLKREGGAVSLVVEDDGAGWRGTGEPRGTGLGTKIVNAMATKLQSTVEVDKAHAGTRVRLSFTL
jgi:two-component sensor histidine kinase